MKIAFFTLFCSLLMLISGCGIDKQETKELCDCVTTETGEWDMYLSPACAELCKDTFGEDLNGMEEWFQQNCERLYHPKTTEENKIML
jgi:hypothetical protein